MTEKYLNDLRLFPIGIKIKLILPRPNANTGIRGSSDPNKLKTVLDERNCHGLDLLISYARGMDECPQTSTHIPSGQVVVSDLKYLAEKHPNQNYPKICLDMVVDSLGYVASPDLREIANIRRTSEFARKKIIGSEFYPIEAFYFASMFAHVFGKREKLYLALMDLVGDNRTKELVGHPWIGTTILEFKSAIVLNQTDRGLLKTWEDAILERDAPSKGSLYKIEFMPENSYNGLDSFSHMRPLRGDINNPPIDILPHAFALFATTIERKYSNSGEDNKRHFESAINDILKRVPEKEIKPFLEMMQNYFTQNMVNSRYQIPVWAFEAISSVMGK